MFVKHGAVVYWSALQLWFARQCCRRSCRAYLWMCLLWSTMIKFIIFVLIFNYMYYRSNRHTKSSLQLKRCRIYFDSFCECIAIVLSVVIKFVTLDWYTSEIVKTMNSSESTERSVLVYLTI